MSRKVLLFGFVALIQLAVPVWMIVGHERVRNEGVLFKFKTAPIDPRDPFRGEYVRLDFAAESGEWTIANGTQTGNTRAYALLGTDDEGFATVTSLLLEAPSDAPYLPIIFSTWGDAEITRIRLPFDRFYLEEGDGKKTEDLLTPEWNGDEMVPTLPSYAEVRILSGEAVITDLIVGDRSIHEWLKEVP
ncbi:MAG: GDYXXLXY domain-containing protein [Flavobacteriales bacterium]|jgi:uncharacterized membrane-anchored protein|nr:GDYXXLXY domain-containing protein [Flavobacteriales bacterium]MBK6884563.1 GDYXXLXY domain-containing protein [Flavobacteriales bacterium]MBK7100964.1 GDYXXLXY domain-containing protein [Flavobacteriales bacterium]MBK7483989.1 GDYXXLXY domain-containing protein [Flavobacteriales bacterium]MBK8709408.1 GDYXXLXY domain-containing protein [Flavobacteriales bacterium]